MDRCRVCLAKSRNLRSVFELDNNVSFADMISSISNVKITENDENNSKICRTCGNKLIEFYELKQQIERSDSILRETSGQPLKRLCFNNFNDMKTKIEIDIKPIAIKQEPIHMLFGCDYFNISDTTIKKLTKIKSKENRIPILDFLKTIEDDTNRNSDYDYDDFDGDAYSDEESKPLILRKLKKIKRKKKGKIKDFTKTLEEDNGNSDYTNTDVDGDAYSDDEYIPLSLKQKLQKPKRHTKEKNKVSDNNKPKRIRRTRNEVPVLLTPVYLENVCTYTNDRKAKRRKAETRQDICPHCGKITKSIQSHLLQHTGERKFQCDQCPSAYFTLGQLKSHKLKHTGERNYKCDQCVATFISKECLKRHKLSHDNTRNFICELCTKGFKRRGALHRHRLMHNSANKNIKCDECNMSFFTKPGLRHHMRVHTGERPFNCEICSQPYSYKHDFNRHCFKKHGVFLKRRKVYVMNEEVLTQERELMKSLMLRAHGIIRDGEPVNPITGPNAAQAFELAMKTFRTQPIPVDLCTD